MNNNKIDFNQGAINVTNGTAIGGLNMSGNSIWIDSSTGYTTYQQMPPNPFFITPDGEVCIFHKEEMVKLSDLLSLLDRVKHLEAEFYLLGKKGD